MYFKVTDEEITNLIYILDKYDIKNHFCPLFNEKGEKIGYDFFIEDTTFTTLVED